MWQCGNVAMWQCVAERLRRIHLGCPSWPNIKLLVGVGSKTSTQLDKTGVALDFLAVSQVLSDDISGCCRWHYSQQEAATQFYTHLTWYIWWYLHEFGPFQPVGWAVYTWFACLRCSLARRLTGVLGSDGFENGDLHGGDTCKPTEALAGYGLQHVAAASYKSSCIDIEDFSKKGYCSKWKYQVTSSLADNGVWQKNAPSTGDLFGNVSYFCFTMFYTCFAPEIFSSGSLCISPFRSGRNLACHELSSCCSCWQSQVVQLYVQPLEAKEWYFTTSATAFHDPGNRVTCLATKKCAHHFKNWIPECYRRLKDCFFVSSTCSLCGNSIIATSRAPTVSDYED